MRDASSTSLVRGVGVNPILAWGRLKIEPDTEPVLEHGLGLSGAIVDGKFVVQVDPGVRPHIWTPLATAIGTESGVIVESFDEAAGSFVVVVKKTGEGPVEEPPPEEPPPEEPPAEEPPAEEPTEPPAEPPAPTFELTPLALGGTVYVSVLVLGVGQ